MCFVKSPRDIQESLIAPRTLSSSPHDRPLRFRADDAAPYTVSDWLLLSRANSTANRDAKRVSLEAHDHYVIFPVRPLDWGMNCQKKSPVCPVRNKSLSAFYCDYQLSKA